MSTSANTLDLVGIKTRLQSIVDSNRRVFKELSARYSNPADLEAAAKANPILESTREAFNLEIRRTLMGCTLLIEPEAGLIVGGEVIRVMMSDTNADTAVGVMLHIITRDQVDSINEFRIPLAALDQLEFTLEGPPKGRSLH